MEEKRGGEHEFLSNSVRVRKGPINVHSTICRRHEKRYFVFLLLRSAKRRVCGRKKREKVGKGDISESSNSSSSRHRSCASPPEKKKTEFPVKRLICLFRLW